MSDDRKAGSFRMSATLRSRLEDVLSACNDYNPHVAGDMLAEVLGYDLNECGERQNDEAESPDEDDEANFDGLTCAEALRRLNVLSEYSVMPPRRGRR